ncbi:hypothetical protein, partial [Deminuibacter soli]
QLQRLVPKAIRHYNEKRIHQSLGWRSPADYERWLKGLKKAQRPKWKIYKKEASLQSNVFCK